LKAGIRAICFAWIALLSTAAVANPTAAADVRSKVQRTLAEDNASLGMFRYLGKLHCIGRVTQRSSDLLTEEYGSLYNHLYPLPRLITLEAMTQSFRAVESRLAATDVYKHKSKTDFMDAVSLCHKLYEQRQTSRRHFVALVRRDASYHPATEADIEQYSRDYLEKYFISRPSTQ